MLGSKYQLGIVRKIKLRRSQGSGEIFYSLRFDNFLIVKSEILQNAPPRMFVIQSYQFHEMEPIVCPRPTCRDVPHWVFKMVVSLRCRLGNQVNETQIIAFKETLTKFWLSDILPRTYYLFDTRKLGN